ncbi:unnamed protein product [Litomosoides sigmodontis]|uniref:C3H1-type domain-containing protein n=1 Tax=Litomosoides sigmodontis TaxID=42156 RepID=A0A3P6TCB9_LITSI|nr:unnamed protein product [Litomosoides sigmodontis]
MAVFGDTLMSVDCGDDNSSDSSSSSSSSVVVQIIYGMIALSSSLSLLLLAVLFCCLLITDRLRGGKQLSMIMRRAISLFEARIRAFFPNNGVSVASTTDVCRLEILTNAHFLSDIKIAKLVDASNEKESNALHSNGSTDMATFDNSPNTVPSTLTVPYPVMSPFNLMQQLALPFCLDITHQPDASAAAAAAAAAVFNIAAAANFATQTALLQHPTAALDPFAAAQVAATASQLLQERHEQVVQQLQVNNSDLNVTSNGYQRNESNNVAEDLKSQKEAKIEVFSEDENDYGGEEDDNFAFKANGDKNICGLESNEGFAEATNVAMDRHHQSYDQEAAYNIAEYVNEYPPLPTAGSGIPLCYSAVVKGIKPSSNNNKPSFKPIKECSSVIPQRNTSSVSTTPSQMSQWDQMTIERGGKFSKPAPQCIHWNNPKHRLDFPCRFWHPREQCRYYPNCSNTADDCGFAHPFCGDFCRCPKGKRDPQKNHRIPEERYFGSGDRTKYPSNNDTQ